MDDKRAGAAKSNAVLYDMGPNIQWVQSYVAGDKVYCVYQATSAELIREHAKRSGFPADKITPIAAVLDPPPPTRRIEGSPPLWLVDAHSRLAPWRGPRTSLRCTK